MALYLDPLGYKPIKAPRSPAGASVLGDFSTARLQPDVVSFNTAAATWRQALTFQSKYCGGLNVRVTTISITTKMMVAITAVTIIVTIIGMIVISVGGVVVHVLVTVMMQWSIRWCLRYLKG